MGFEWDAMVERDKGKAAQAAINELWEWVQNPLTPELLTYFANELARISLILPEQADDVWMYEIMPDGTKIEGSEVTYKEYFSHVWPKKGEALLYAFELPWLWKIPSEVLAKAAELFEKHGVLDVWWGIVEYGAAASDLMDRFWEEKAEEIFGGPIEVSKLKKKGCGDHLGEN